MACTVYLIKNIRTGEVYVGSTRQETIRRDEHWARLRRGTHRNKALQAAWQEHGPLAFEFEVIWKDFDAEDIDMLIKEQRELTARKLEGRCYNASAAMKARQLRLFEEGA